MRRRSEAGAAFVEYVMLLGLITAVIVFFLTLVYPSVGDDIESLVNAWGDRLATQIAGDKISEATEDAWGIN